MRVGEWRYGRVREMDGEGVLKMGRVEVAVSRLGGRELGGGGIGDGDWDEDGEGMAGLWIFGVVLVLGLLWVLWRKWRRGLRGRVGRVRRRWRSGRWLKVAGG